MTILANSPPATHNRENGSSPVILNLGCGPKTSARCINVDWSMYMMLRQNAWVLPIVGPIIGADRAARIRAMRGTMVRHDLRRGIPLADGAADAVYHSHVMEHIPREAVPGFQREILRVLKPGGIQRLCLPDLEQLVRDYNRSLAADDASSTASRRHDEAVAAMFEQCVRDMPGGGVGRSPLRVSAEKLLLGDARARGEIHRWMWDRVNLRAVLSDAGFTDITVRTWNDSAIADWPATGLECDADGREHQPMSLYMECRKPG